MASAAHIFVTGDDSFQCVFSERSAKGLHVGSYLFRAWCCLWAGGCLGVSLVAVASVCTQYRLEGSGSAASYQTAFGRDANINCATARTEILRQADLQGYPANRAVSVDSCTLTAAVFTLTFQNPGYSAGSSTFNWGSAQRTGDFCQPSACDGKTGTSGTRGFTRGWLRSPPTVVGTQVWPDMVGGPTPEPGGSQACVEGCSASVGAAADTYVSLVPSPTGLYRVSEARVVTFGTSECSMGANDSNNPATPPRACDGFVGVVNGNTRCVAPSGAAPVPAPKPPDAKNGNPKAGANGALPIGSPDLSPPDGDGGNGGGPPAAGDGSLAGGASAGSPGAPAAPPGPGTGASGGGTPGTGNDGKNTEGGACERNPNAAGCGGSATAAPVLYTGKGKTVAEVLAAARDRASSSGIGAAASSFFTVSSGGVCPTWSAHIPFINADLVIDQFCSVFAAQMFAFMRIALLLVASVMAFRIAIDN